ncbi:unnamed protein product [Sympodiomycopsis kandeliae]
MSYQRPQDPYIHSNASQYDNQYQSHQGGGYSDYGNGGGHGGYGHQTPQSDHYYKEAGAGAGGYAAGSGHNPAQTSANKYAYAPPKKGTSKWVKYGIPAAIVAILIIAGAVLGGIFGSRASNDKNNTAETGGSTFSGTSGTNRASNIDSSTAAKASSAAQAGGVDNIFYQGTDLYGNPAYPKGLDTAAPSSGAQAVSCSDSSPPSGSTAKGSLRDHPRIMAPGYQWDCLPEKISKDAYLTVWNASIFQNATAFYSMPPTNYSVDGTFSGSGILDPARELQLRVKTWAYAYRISKDTKWLDRTWTELRVASGNDTSDGNWDAQAVDPKMTATDTWNPAHFLDTAEATAAFAIAYDWLYDVWTQDQRDAIMWSIITLGLNQGANQYSTDAGWWRKTNGNWNCVCNSGLLLGALAIGNEDPTGVSQSLIGQIIPNMKDNCMMGAYDDGTWSETANYWYFGTNAQARAQSALITATGNDQGLMAANPGFQKTGLFHMYVGGQAGLYAYGDNGPNKFSTNANGMFLWASQGKQPVYALYQRDRADAADPLSMFWYDTSSKGAFWNGLALDQFFNNELGSWGSMRSSWSDFTGTYIGVKSSNATGHQTHGDLDAGDFVIDALGTRWAGEYGSGNYLSQNYFSNETQGSERWEYFRKGTQGQNTLVINNGNQQADCSPVNEMKSTGVKQSGDVDFVPATTDAAYFKTDMSSCYGQSANTVVRGIRFLNGRRQILVQDEIAQNAGITSVQWRVQTNGTVTLSDDKKTATLTIEKVTDPNAAGGAEALVAKLDSKKTMVVKILNPTDGEFSTNGPPTKRIYGSDPNPKPNEYGPDEDGDQENVGVTALQIQMKNPSGKIQVLWQPQWENLNSADSATPKDVDLANWSVTSHN